MRRAPLVIAAIALLALTGCSAAAPVAPTDAAPSSAAPTADPTASAPAASDPAASDPAASESPSASATPSADATDDGTCGSDYPVALMAWYGPVGSFEGDAAEQRAQANPRPGFEPSAMLDGLDVACTLTWETRDLRSISPDAIATLSLAVVRAADDDLSAELERWVRDRGYQYGDFGDEGDEIWSLGQARRADGSLASLSQLTWRQVGVDPPGAGDEQLLLEHIDAEAGDWVLMHHDWSE